MNSFVLADPGKCIGCHTCEAACIVAHSDQRIFEAGGDEAVYYPRLTVVETEDVTAPVQCRHCEDAPCANVCPNGSITNREHSIFINQDTCIGCKTCAVVCPYGAITMVAAYSKGRKQLQRGLRVQSGNAWSPKPRMVANKCDLCEDTGGGPECVRVCPTHALQFIASPHLDESIARKRTGTVQMLQSYGGFGDY
ncbi:formate dehydrogenase [Paenibacillus stellifer]|uniref:Formate dehydrogenase n=1 Tax=Paenibacillus stellifer TaxID=169760 RepID=A0A089LST0_9BACL|nr:4Fe-4S dicluster domain-containing protein [Paenibacillus stellifer]AIQ63927.1 formate dehydrogenase [Paenibacillus stellifer]